jgi:hypothetical protein
VLGSTSYGEQAGQFIETAYRYGWVRTLAWSKWRVTERGRHLLTDADGLNRANEDDLACVITTCLRADRFCEGYLAEAFKAGLISRVVERADRLLAAMPSFGR